MSDTATDYWPADLFTAEDPEPVTLLKDQADRLRGRTNGRVLGVVDPGVVEGTLYYSLYLTVPELGDYRFKVLYIAYPVSREPSNPWPISAQDSFGGPEVKIGNMDNFREWLKSILSSSKVKSVVGNLMRPGSRAS